MAQDPNDANAAAAAADADANKGGLSWKGMIQAAKDKKNELAEKMEKLDKDTTDIVTLMEMALVELTAYEKRLNDLADGTEGKVNLLSQFARAKGVIYIHSIKVGVGMIGGAYGRGILIANSDAGWSLPLALTKPEVKLGPQMEAIEEDSILLLSSSKSVDSFATGKSANLTVGFDAFVAFADKGQAVGSSNMSVNASGQKGFGGGATVDFGSFNEFIEANEAFYGKDYDKSRILNITPEMDSDIVKNLGKKLDSTKKFIETLSGFAAAAQDEIAIKK